MGENARPRIVNVSGDIDIARAPELHQSLLAALGDPSGEVVVDLREVSFIDSTGLGVLVNARQRAKVANTKFQLILPEGQARFPFEVTGLVSVFERQEPGAAARVASELDVENS